MSAAGHLQLPRNFCDFSSAEPARKGKDNAFQCAQASLFRPRLAHVPAYCCSTNFPADSVPSTFDPGTGNQACSHSIYLRQNRHSHSRLLFQLRVVVLSELPATSAITAETQAPVDRVDRGQSYSTNRQSTAWNAASRGPTRLNRSQCGRWWLRPLNTAVRYEPR